MSKFGLKEIEDIKGQIKFYKLLVNGNCEFDDFMKEMKKNLNLKEDLFAIQTALDNHAKLFRLPPTRYKELTGRKSNDSIKDFEVKSGSLRIYFFKDEKGKVIVCGGYKGNQDKDISRMRKIKLEYFKNK